jgi:glycerol-3-phosphate dehydrogenase
VRYTGPVRDVVVIGGGVVGCAVAWRLSTTGAAVTLVEAAHDLCEGASKGNTGITTSGADCRPGTLEAELVRRSSPGWEALCARLDTPFERIGTLAVAVTADEEARANGAPAEIVSGEAARELEPLVTPQARAALHFPEDGIIDSIRLTLGYAELAARNGVQVLRSSPVTAIERSGDRITAVQAGTRRIETRAVVNAAGLGAGRISELAGGDPFTMWPRQGQYWLLDRELGGRFRKVVGGVPTETTRGIYCVPTTNRSLLLGPTAVDHDDPTDRAVDAGTLEAVFEAAQRLVPAVRREYAIKTFAANRPASEPVYRVGPDGRVMNLVHAAAIRSTGVSSSPAVAELVRSALEQLGLPVAGERPGALTALEPLPRLLGHADPGALFRLRAGDGGGDRGGPRDGRARDVARGRPQAHPRDRRAVPGGPLPGRRVVPALDCGGTAAGGDRRVRARRHAGSAGRWVRPPPSSSSAPASRGLAARTNCAERRRRRSSTACRSRVVCTDGTHRRRGS